MKVLLRMMSYTGLLLTLVPSVLVFNQLITLEQHKIIALAGTLLWIATAPFWINEKNEQDSG